MTYLEIVNRVLRRLREDEVTDFSADYTKVIADFVGEAHAEIIAAHDWSFFYDQAEVTLTNGANEVSLNRTTDGTVYTLGNGQLHLTELSQLLYVDGNRPVVAYYPDASTTQGVPLPQISWQDYTRRTSMDYSRTGTPSAFALRRDGDNMGWVLGVPETIDVTGSRLIMSWYVPEDPLSVEDSLTTRTPMVSARSLILGALYLALGERGEEIGEPGNVAEARYYKSIMEERENDILNSGRTNRYEFYRD